MKSIFVVSLTACLFCLVGCRPVISPLEQVERLNPAYTKAKKAPVAKVANARITEYTCAQGKTLQIQTQAKSKKITLTFNQISHRLSSTISRSGKKYSNIRWTWIENAKGVGRLQDSHQHILAEQCVRKEH